MEPDRPISAIITLWIDRSGTCYQALPNAVKLQIAVEVEAGLRSKYWLPRYGITQGKPITVNKAKRFLLKLLGLEKGD